MASLCDAPPRVKGATELLLGSVPVSCAWLERHEGDPTRVPLPYSVGVDLPQTSNP